MAHTLVVVLQDPVDEPRLLRYCDELESLLGRPNFEITIFKIAARIMEGVLEAYSQQGATMSDSLKRRVLHINYLTLLKGIPPMLRVF
jgi:hypothetical protein